MTGMELCRIWAGAIMADAALQRLVLERTGAALKVAIGYDVVTDLDEGDCPYVVLQPMTDDRGPDATENQFEVGVFLGVCLEGGPVPGPGGVPELPCLAFMDDEFCPAVLRALDPAQPCPGLAEGELQMPRAGYVEKYLRLTCKLPNTIGLGADIWG